jgi:hypothetical protein
MRARARCHTCSRFIPFPLSLTKTLLFPIRRRAACRRRRSIALFTVCRYAHVDKRTQSPHRNQSTSGLSLSAFSLSAAFQTPDRRPFSTIDLTTNRRETRASSIYRLRHPSFPLFPCARFVIVTRHDRVLCGASSSPASQVFLCALTERSPATTFTVLAARNLEGLSLLPRCCSSFAHRVPSNSLEDVSLSLALSFLCFLLDSPADPTSALHH